MAMKDWECKNCGFLEYRHPPIVHFYGQCTRRSPVSSRPKKKQQKETGPCPNYTAPDDKTHLWILAGLRH